jgi:Kef-type K+ transport system membrane component KefB
MVLGAFAPPSGPVLEFLVLFGVILLGPVILVRFRLPGVIGLVLGGFAIGAHGFGLIAAGNHTVPELGQLGLLYLMFVAGLELDLHMLKEYRVAAVVLGLLAFAIPMAAGIGIGLALGWSIAATILLGALFSSHTLIVYPTLRDAGLGGHPSVATAVGATVLTDTLALVVLAVVAGTQTASGSAVVVLGEIALGFAVLIVVGLVLLPRAVDAAYCRLGSDRVARYLVVIVALLSMAAVAEIFGIEAIIGAFFAGLALNRLVPNEGPSMERVEFFGSAVFVPIFLVSIGLLLDPSVMFTGETLGIAGLICAGAIGGKAIASWTAGALLGFNRVECVTMFTLTVPQAAATLAVTVIGYEIGLFGTSLVNAVLVLILVSIVVGALLAEKVIGWVPKRAERKPLGRRLVVVTGADGPSDRVVRVAMLLARPDGGHSEVVITGTKTRPPPDAGALRAVEERIFRKGFEGGVRTEIDELEDAVTRAALSPLPSAVLVDDPTFDSLPVLLPLLVVDGADGADGVRVIAAVEDAADVSAEVERRLGRKNGRPAAVAPGRG